MPYFRNCLPQTTVKCGGACSDYCCLGMFTADEKGDRCRMLCNFLPEDAPEELSTACTSVQTSYCPIVQTTAVGGSDFGSTVCQCVDLDKSTVTQEFLGYPTSYQCVDYVVQLITSCQTYEALESMLNSQKACWWPPCFPDVPGVLRPSAFSDCPSANICFAFLENINVSNSTNTTIAANCLTNCQGNSMINNDALLYSPSGSPPGSVVPACIPCPPGTYVTLDGTSCSSSPTGGVGTPMPRQQKPMGDTDPAPAHPMSTSAATSRRASWVLPVTIVCAVLLAFLLALGCYLCLKR